ncbi:protein BTG4 [Genypterus blacodes]|uniref:protein BTG4 n=1 Tax=Genypterus blacodes TaxID=154954 RepID=UPI003F7575B1
MKDEIAAAVFFVTQLAKRYGSLDNDSRQRFAAALTSVLFEKYKNHWHLNAPSKGQAYRCLRVNGVCLQDSSLQQACERSGVQHGDLGLPKELTLWVDPGEVSCRYGEHSAAFSVSLVESCRRGDGEFSRRIQDAVERASLDVQSGGSSDEEECGDNSMSSSMSSSSSSSSSSSTSIPAEAPQPKSIPTVSNPNSVYRFTKFAAGAPQTWLTYPKWKPFAGDSFPPSAPPSGGSSSQFSGQKVFKSHRATFTFTGPRVDKYHWVSKTLS